MMMINVFNMQLITIALNYDKIGNNHQRVDRVKPFIDQYNWKDKYSISR